MKPFKELLFVLTMSLTLMKNADSACAEFEVNNSYYGNIDGLYTKTIISCHFVTSYQRNDANDFIYYNNNGYWIIGNGLCVDDNYMNVYARGRASDGYVSADNATVRWEERVQTIQGPEVTWRRNSYLSVVCHDIIIPESSGGVPWYLWAVPSFIFLLVTIALVNKAKLDGWSSCCRFGRDICHRLCQCCESLKTLGKQCSIPKPRCPQFSRKSSAECNTSVDSEERIQNTHISQDTDGNADINLRSHQVVLNIDHANVHLRSNQVIPSRDHVIADGELTDASSLDTVCHSSVVSPDTEATSSRRGATHGANIRSVDGEWRDHTDAVQQSSNYSQRDRIRPSSTQEDYVEPGELPLNVYELPPSYDDIVSADEQSQYTYLKEAPPAYSQQ